MTGASFLPHRFRLLFLAVALVVLAALFAGDASVQAQTAPSTGALDASFDADGKVTTAIGPGSSSLAFAMALQPDGKIVVAGGFNVASGGSQDYEFALARYNSNGSLDTAFDADGKVTTTFSASNDFAEGVAVQSDGKIVAAGVASNGSDNDFALARYNANGSLDTSFSADGKVLTAFSANNDGAKAVAVQSDGKIVVVGGGHNGSDNDFALARYNANGSLDTSFSADGKVLTDFSGGHDVAQDVVVLPGGKIVVAGQSHNGSVTVFALARYNANGSLDTSFDTDGKVTTIIDSGENNGMAVAVQSDGKIVVAGRVFQGSGNNDIALARYNANGSLDTSFDADGKVSTDFGSGKNEEARDVAVQSDGKIVVAGWAYNGNNNDFMLARYNANGSLDTSFDTDGKVTTAIGSGDDRGYAMAVQSDGKIVVAGWGARDRLYEFALARYGDESTAAVWSGTLTVQDYGWDEEPTGSPLGCSSAYTDARSCTTSLSGGSSFTHAGTTYEITGVLRRGGTLMISADKALPSDWALVVGGSVWLSSHDDTRANLPDNRVWDHTNIGAWSEGDTVSLSLVVPSDSVPTVSLTAQANPVLEGETVTMVATLSSALTADVVIPVYTQGRFSEPGDHGTLSSITVSAGDTTGTAVIATNHDTGSGSEVFRVALRPSLPTAVRPAISTDAMVPFKYREVWVDIIDDEAPRPNVWLIGSVIHSPGDPVNVLHEGGEARVTVSMSDTFFSDVTIPLKHYGVGRETHWYLNAADPGDYTVPEKVVIPYRQGGAEARIHALQDNDTEDDTFAVEIDKENLPNWLKAKEPGRPTGWRFTIRDDEPSGTGDRVPPTGRHLPCQNCAILDEPGVMVNPRERYAALIDQMYEWRNDPQWVSYKSHTDRWDRALLAFGEEVADASLTPMTAAEAQAFADSGMNRWSQVARALTEIEAGPQPQQPANRAPTVSAALGDVTIVNQSGHHPVSLSGVFDDPDGDSLTISAASSDEAVATASVASSGSILKVSGVSEGTATVTVTASDGNGGSASDSFRVEVVGKYSVLIAQMYQWRNDPDWKDHKSHTDRWDRALLALGEEVADQTLTPMTAAEAQAFVDSGMERWHSVARALREIESAPPPQQQPGTPNRAPTVSAAIGDITIVNESGSQQVSLAGVFEDADNDSLSITAASSDEAVTTVSVASDGSSLTVSGKSRGAATVTVTADDGNGGTVDDAFTVTVKAAPAVASALADVSGLGVGATQEVSLAGVFSDADGDSLTITAAASDEAVATVSVASDGSVLTLAGVAAGTATITVTAQDSDGNTVSDEFGVSVVAPPQQQQPGTPNRAPTVGAAIGDATIVHETGTSEVSLSGVFDDADSDSLTISAASSNNGVATASVSADQSTLTVTAKSRGTATITVTANDGNGGSVSDSFDVRVKAAPAVASAIGDVSGLSAGTTREVSLSGVFSDADGDSLTITAAASDEAVATVSVASDGSVLTLAGVAAGTATITVTAQDSDGNTVSDTFDVSVEPAPEEEEREQPTSDGAPTVISPLADVSLKVLRHRTISLPGVFTDPDGDALSISAEASDYSVVYMSMSGSSLLVVARSEGTATITVTAEDPDGNTVSDAFEVTVTPAS